MLGCASPANPTRMTTVKMENNRAQALALLAGNGGALFLAVSYLIEEVSGRGMSEISAAAAIFTAAQLYWVHLSYQALRHAEDAAKFKQPERNARLGFGATVMSFVAVVLFFFFVK